MASLRAGRIILMSMAMLLLTSSVHGQDDTTPVLIKKSPVAIQQAWSEVQKKIEENKKLEKPLPDPYLARAELWTMVGNHEDALEDQLKALELLYQREPSLIEQKRYLLRIQKTMNELQKMPRPYYPLDAEKLYYLGKAYYFQCNFKKALTDLTEAIRLNPREPAYWYYRGLTYKALEEEGKAKRDIRVAGSMRRAKKPKKDVSLELERIQGSLRKWLTDIERELPETR